VKPIEAITVLLALAACLALLSLATGCADLAEVATDQIPACLDSDLYGCVAGTVCVSGRCRVVCESNAECPSECCGELEDRDDVRACAAREFCLH
jgi:hypothetical protein